MNIIKSKTLGNVNFGIICNNTIQFYAHFMPVICRGGGSSGSGSSSNTCENYSESKEEVSRIQKSVSEETSKKTGYYLHIEKDCTSYLGTYSYTVTIPAYTYDEVKYKITYTCKDGMHDLSSWSYDIGPET